jgi:hypothetical protein
MLHRIAAALGNEVTIEFHEVLEARSKRDPSFLPAHGHTKSWKASVRRRASSKGLPSDRNIARQLGRTGQVASFRDLQALVFDFEKVLLRFNIPIEKGSELEGACCSVLEILGKNQNKDIRNPHEDIRHVFTEVLGIWMFLKKVVRLQNHLSFGQFVPHLKLLNEGTVVQNKRLRACQDASNKIFELLFALVILDVSTEVSLAHPNLEDTSNPDILATIDGQLWGFACKTIYGASGKTFFDNLKKGVEQIEVSAAQLGCVVVNLRNLLDHDTYWPILNEAEYRKGAEPIFAAYTNPADVVGPQIWEIVTKKRDQVVKEIGLNNVLNLLVGKKALPAFLAFCQTVTGKASTAGPIPTSIVTLSIGTFGNVQAHHPVFDKMNMALHECGSW